LGGYPYGSMPDVTRNTKLRFVGGQRDDEAQRRGQRGEAAGAFAQDLIRGTPYNGF